MVQKLIRLDGLAICLASLYLYHRLDGSWILFILLFLTPDLTALFYKIDSNLGSKMYNGAHNYTTALLLAILGLLLNFPILTNFGLIVSAHIGIDRFAGYGLKYPTDFKDTHIKRL